MRIIGGRGSEADSIAELSNDYRRVLGNIGVEGESMRLFMRAAGLLDAATKGWERYVEQTDVFSGAWGRAIIDTTNGKSKIDEGGVSSPSWLDFDPRDRLKFLNVVFDYLARDEELAREVKGEILAPVDAQRVASRLGEFAAFGGDPSKLLRALWGSYTREGPSLTSGVWWHEGKVEASDQWLRMVPHYLRGGLPPLSDIVGPALWRFYKTYGRIIYVPEGLGGFAYSLRYCFSSLTTEYVNGWTRHWGYDKRALMLILLFQKERPRNIAEVDPNQLEKDFRGLLSKILVNHCNAMRTLSVMQQRLDGINVGKLREIMTPESLAEVIGDILSAPLDPCGEGRGEKDKTGDFRSVMYTPVLNPTARGFWMLEHVIKTAGEDGVTYLSRYISVKK